MVIQFCDLNDLKLYSLQIILGRIQKDAYFFLFQKIIQSFTFLEQKAIDRSKQIREYKKNQDYFKVVNKNRLKVQNEGLRSFENCPIKSELSQLFILNKKRYSNIIRSSTKKKNSRSKKRRKNSFSCICYEVFF